MPRSRKASLPRTQNRPTPSFDTSMPRREKCTELWRQSNFDRFSKFQAHSDDPNVRRGEQTLACACQAKDKAIAPETTLLLHIREEPDRGHKRMQTKNSQRAFTPPPSEVSNVLNSLWGRLLCFCNSLGLIEMVMEACCLLSHRLCICSQTTCLATSQPFVELSICQVC